jgi:1,4-dihydroxy-2-naphthoate octaprenyltransferase
VSTHSDGPTLNGALAGTGMLEFLFCVLLAAGVWLS